MSDFSFSGLLKPGDAARLALIRELETRRERWTPRPGYVYRGGGDFLLQHGRVFGGRRLPDEFAQLQGAPNMCFLNALEAAEANPRLRYCEGVYSTGGGHFTPHAWCLDDADEMVEVTFPTRDLDAYHDEYGRQIMPPEHWAYYGVVFSAAFARWHGENVGFPMLDRPAADQSYTDVLDVEQPDDFPLLTVPFDPTRTSL